MKQIIKNRIDKHYRSDNRYAKLNMISDSILAIIVIVLIASNIYISTSNSGQVLGDQNNNNDNNVVIDNGKDNQDNNTTTADATNTTDNNDNTNNETPDNPNIDPVEPIIILPTNITFETFAKYYTTEGEQLGVGPNPPVAGETTKYWVFLSIDDFTHNLENVTLSAKLGDHVSFTGKSSVTHGNNIVIDNELKTIHWILGNITKDSRNSNTIGAALEVEITPVVSQVGQIPVLVDQIKLSAYDSEAEKEIIKYNNQITTNLISDKISNNNGRVLAQ